MRRQLLPAANKKLIGGESGIPDDLLVRDAIGNVREQSKYAACSGESVTMANSANPRIDYG